MITTWPRSRNAERRDTNGGSEPNRQQPGQEEEVPGRNAPRLGRNGATAAGREGQQRPAEKAAGRPKCHRTRRCMVAAASMLPAEVERPPASLRPPRGRHLMTRGYAALVAAIVSLAGAPVVVHGQSPAEVRIGYTPLTLVAEGSATDQLGGEALYTIAVYTRSAAARPRIPRESRNRQGAADSRSSATTTRSACSTRPWRRELVPRLDAPPTTQLLAIDGNGAGRATSCWSNTHPGGAPPSGETRGRPCRAPRTA